MFHLLIGSCTSRSPFDSTKILGAFLEDDPEDLQIWSKQSQTSELVCSWEHEEHRVKKKTQNFQMSPPASAFRERLFIHLPCLFRFIPPLLSSHRETIVCRDLCDSVQCQVAVIVALLQSPVVFKLDHSRTGNDRCLQLLFFHCLLIT